MRRTPLLAIASARSSSTAVPTLRRAGAAAFSVRSVAVVPGWMALTLTPSRMPRRDRPLVKFASAELTDPPMQEFGLDGARRAADDVDHMAVRGFEQRPEEPRQPHGAEEFERKAVEPEHRRDGQEVAGAGRARAVDQHVAALEALVDLRENLLAARERAQIARDRHRLGPAGFDDGLGCLPPDWRPTTRRARIAPPRAQNPWRSHGRCRGCRRRRRRSFPETHPPCSSLLEGLAAILAFCGSARH